MNLESFLSVPPHRSSLALAQPVLLACLMGILASCGKSGSSGGGGGSAQDAGDKPLDHPAKVAEAAHFLDLSTVPVMAGADPINHRTLANLNYRVAGDVKTVFEFQRKNLAAQRWTELSGSTVTDQYGSGTFSRAGFHVSVSASSGGASGPIDVTLHNHGNIDLSKLPLPPAVKAVYVGPITAMNVTEAPVADTAKSCRDLLAAAGWEPHGTAGDTSYYKQNAIRLTVTVSAAPAQGGKTMINYMSELMSADIPAPKDAQDVQYIDSQKRLRFQTAATQDAVSAFYREALAPAGWAATMTRTVKIDDKDTLIFRNPAKDMLSLEMREAAGGKTDVSLTFQTMAEIDELEKRVAAQGAALKEKLKADASKPTPKITVTLPAGAEGVAQTKNEIKFTVGNGKAKAVVEAMRTQYVDAGWKEDIATLDPMAGTVSLSQKGKSLTITYIDTGVLPVEITINSTGAELER